MRISNLHLGREPVVHIGLLVAVVGEGVMALVVLFLLSLPIAVGNGHGVWNSDLPLVERAEAPPTETRHGFIIVPRSGAMMIDGKWVEARELKNAIASSRRWNPDGFLVYAHASAPAESVQRALRAAIEGGAKSLGICVRIRNGEYGTVPVDLQAPLPELPTTARAQDVVDALGR